MLRSYFFLRHSSLSRVQVSSLPCNLYILVGSRKAINFQYFEYFLLQECERASFQLSASLSLDAVILNQHLPSMASCLCPGIRFSNKCFCITHFSSARTSVGISTCFPKLAYSRWLQSFAEGDLLWIYHRHCWTREVMRYQISLSIWNQPLKCQTFLWCHAAPVWTL